MWDFDRTNGKKEDRQAKTQAVRKKGNRHEVLVTRFYHNTTFAIAAAWLEP